MRDSDGRFIISITFKHELAQLGTSRDIACKRSLEKVNFLLYIILLYFILLYFFLL